MSSCCNKFPFSILEHCAVDSMVFSTPSRLGRAGSLPPTHAPLRDLFLCRSSEEACNFSSFWVLFIFFN